MEWRGKRRQQVTRQVNKKGRCVDYYNIEEYIKYEEKKKRLE